jgi:hypothetical protein
VSNTIPSRFVGLLGRLRERGEVRRAGDEWRTCCPAHDDRGPSLYVKLNQDRSRVLLSCRAGCVVQDIVAALDLDLGALFLEGDEPVEVGDAFDLPSDAGPPGEGHDGAGPRPAGGAVPAEPDPDLRHAVYGALLGRLELSDAHRQALRARGLTDPEIDRLGYRTAVRFAVRQAVGEFKAGYGDATLLGIPGFRRARDQVRFFDREGLIVPVRDLGGRVVALKVRLDENGAGGKYVWASGGEGGASCGSPPHVPLGTPAAAEAVRVTEGELKADVAFVRSGLPTVGVPGVANWRAALPLLEALGAKAVHLAFDADARAKAGVARELAACADELLRRGLEVRLEVWDARDGKGVDDLLAAGKAPEVLAGQRALAEVKAIGESAGALGANDEDDWVPADPSAAVLPFPADCLPRPVEQFVTEAAESLQCPIDFVAVPALAAAAAAIGGSRRLRIRPGYEEGARAYFAVVAPPGSAKSPALRKAWAPVCAEQDRRRNQYHEDRARYAADLEAYESAGENPVGAEGRAAAPTEKPVKPVMGHAFVNDVTIECLAQLLEANPRGLLMVRDELTGWVRSLNQYRGGKGADRQFFLSAWSGEPVKVDRKSLEGEPLIVPDPVLSVVGCVTPEMLGELDAGHEGEDGFIHRILFVYPPPLRGRRWSWDGVSAETVKGWHDAVKQLYGLLMGRDDSGGPAAVTVDLTPEARPCWEAWYNRHAAETEADDFPDVLVGPWAKMVAYAARLALVVHLLRFVCKEAAGEAVDAESLRRAFVLVDYFKSHARAVYARFRVSREDRRADKAIAWIRRNGGECQPTDLAKKNVAGVRKKSEAEALMRELVDRGYGSLETRKAGNNKTVARFVARPVG